MSKVTVRQAAELTGKSRQTINDATKDGTLTFSKNGRGHKVIDVSELERVFDIIKKPEEIGQKSGSVKSDSKTTVKPSDWEKQMSTFLDQIAKSNEHEREALLQQIELLNKTVEEVRKDKDTYVRLLEDHSSKKNDEELKRLQKSNDDLAKQVQELLDAEKKREEARQAAIKKRREEKLQQLQDEQSRGFFAKLFG